MLRSGAPDAAAVVSASWDRTLVDGRAVDAGLPSTGSRALSAGPMRGEFRPWTLFEDGDEWRRRLMAAVDGIGDRYGRWPVVPAVQGFRREWRMRAEKRSPCWTTRIAEVPVVVAKVNDGRKVSNERRSGTIERRSR